jgi:hypothetical protein
MSNGFNVNLPVSLKEAHKINQSKIRSNGFNLNFPVSLEEAHKINQNKIRSISQKQTGRSGNAPTAHGTPPSQMVLRPTRNALFPNVAACSTAHVYSPSRGSSQRRPGMTSSMFNHDLRLSYQRLHQVLAPEKTHTHSQPGTTSHMSNLNLQTSHLRLHQVWKPQGHTPNRAILQVPNHDLRIPHQVLHYLLGPEKAHAHSWNTTPQKPHCGL